MEICIKLVPVVTFKWNYNKFHHLNKNHQHQTYMFLWPQVLGICNFLSLKQSSTLFKFVMISVNRPGMTQSFCWGSSPVTRLVSTALSQQALQWKCPQSPRPKKAHQVRSFAFFFIPFFDSHRVVHPPQCQAVKAKQCDVLRHPVEKILLKQLKLWPTGNWVLQHAKRLAQSSLETSKFLTCNTSFGWI